MFLININDFLPDKIWRPAVILAYAIPSFYLVRDRTVIVITHRLPLAVQADLIYVMRSGQIVESGTHDELLAKGRYYAESWRSQMQGDIGFSRSSPLSTV